jgi:hypothetical protein
VLLSSGLDVLIAAHCVDDDGDGMVDPRNVTVTFDLPDRKPVSMSVPSSNIRVHPNWTGDVSDCRGDLALLMLPELAPLGAERFDLYRNSDEVTRAFTFVGYGRSNTKLADGTVLDGTAGAGSPSGTKRLGWNVFDSVVGDTLEFDFDSANARDSLGEFEAGTARGDSGGPSFLDGRIAAITSSGTNENSAIGDIQYNTRVSALAGWIDSYTRLGQRIVVNMTTQLGAADGAADNILVRSMGSNFELFINGRLAQSLPKSQVISLDVRGSGDDDTFTVEGGLDTIMLEGNGGTDSLVIDDRNLSSSASPYYSIDDQSVTRLLSFGSFGQYDDVYYSGLQSIRLESSPLTSRTDVVSNLDSVTLTIVSHDSNDVAIGKGRLDDVGGRVDVHGSGSDSLTLDDSANTSGDPESRMPRYTLMDNSIQFSEVRQIDGRYSWTHDLSVAYSGVNLLELKAGNTSDNINIESHDKNLPANIFAGAGDDVITFSAERHRMIEGSFSIAGGDGWDSLIFNDDKLRNDPIWGTTNQPTFFVGRNDVGYTNHITEPLFNYEYTTDFNADHKEFENLVINGGTTGNLFNVSGTPAGAETLIRAGSGNDTIVAGAFFKNLQYVQGALTIDGGDGFDQLVLDDRGAAISDQPIAHSLMNSNVYRGGYSFTFDPGQLEALTLFTSYGPDSIQVSGTAAGLPVTIDAGPGDDSFDVSLNLSGPLTVMGGPGFDRLVTQERYGINTGQSYVITATSVANSAMQPVKYADVESLEINAGNFPNVFNVQGTAAGVITTISGGNDNDQFLVSDQAVTLDSVRGQLNLHGKGGEANSVRLDDSANTADQVFSMYGSGVYRTGLGADAPIIYENIRTLDLLAGRGNDQLHVRNTAPGVNTSFNGGNGNDTVVIGDPAYGLDAVPGLFTADGGIGTNALIVNDQATKSSATWTRTPASITRDRFDGHTQYQTQVDYSNMHSVVINGGSGANTLRGDTAGSTAPLTMILPIGASGYDDSNVVTTDAAGNVYTSGYFQGTVDFDAGPGVSSLTATGLYDSYLAKYS